MISYLTIGEVLRLHEIVIEVSGGASEILDQGKVESAVAQPQMTFGGEDLYPTIHAKAAALAFSLCQAHAFLDGNKRTAHAAMEAFLIRNGYEIDADVDEQEEIFLNLAAGKVSRETLAEWIQAHIQALH